VIRLGSTSEETADRVVAAIIVIGVLGAPFYRTGALRGYLVGTTATASLAVVATLCISLALAWWSLMHRSYLWADPAWLTWSDFDGSRPAMLVRRLLIGWALRFVAVAYAAGVSAMLLGWQASQLPLCGALFAAVALLAFVAARRVAGPALRWIEQLMPLVLTVLGVLVASGAIGSTVLWGVAAVAVVLALALAFGGSLPSAAGRMELIERFTARMVRRVSVSFLDVWTLLPAGRPLRWAQAFAGRAVVARFVAVGVLTRVRSLLFAIVLALTVAALHFVFPTASPVWWMGVGTYLAVLPFAAPIAQLNRVAGLRRWLNCTDRSLKATTAGVLLVVAVCWLGVALLLGVPWSVPSALIVLVAVAAVVRTVTRSPVDFGNLGIVSFEGVLVPAGLIVQLARGPEVLLIGLLLMGTGVTLAVAVPIVVLLALYAALR
jgi:hypothetical protein